MSTLDRGITRALVLALVALSFAGCESSERKRAEILFSRGAQGPLYVLDEATGATRQFAATKDLWWIETTQWSADGDQIVLTGHEAPPAIQYGTGEVYIAGAEGGALRPVTGKHAAEYDPAFSPDASRLAFIRGKDCGYRGGGSDVVVLDLDGGSPRRLTNDCLAHDELSWSPDGAALLFTASRIVISEIHVLDIGTGDERRLTESRGGQPRWSPDGAWIAFTDSRPRGQYLVVIRADGSDERDLVAVTRNGSGIHGPAWSPDGRTIAYSVLNADGSARIELVKKAGNGRLVVAGGEGQANVSPAWSADGKKIAFVQHVRDDRPRGARIVVVPADGQNLRAFPKTAIYDRFTAIEPRWRP